MQGSIDMVHVGQSNRHALVDTRSTSTALADKSHRPGPHRAPSPKAGRIDPSERTESQPKHRTCKPHRHGTCTGTRPRPAEPPANTALGKSTYPDVHSRMPARRQATAPEWRAAGGNMGGGTQVATVPRAKRASTIDTTNGTLTTGPMTTFCSGTTKAAYRGRNGNGERRRLRAQRDGKHAGNARWHTQLTKRRSHRGKSTG